MTVRNRQRRLPLDTRRLERELARAAGSEGLGDQTIAFVLVSDRSIRRLNRKFHGRDDVTDVLAFDYRPTSQPDDVDAEVVVSAHRAEAEALGRGLPADGELLLYCLHGLLHLAGYDDRDPAGRRRMWKRQLEHLAEAGYPVRRWREPMADTTQRHAAPEEP